MIMENEKNTVVLNHVLINKLDSIGFDIKYYININAGISQTLDEDSVNHFKFIDDEDMKELVEIRKRTKQLAAKLKIKLNTI